MCAAPKGNKFWEKRAKHGRDKLFESAELLRQAAYEYFEWCEANPLIEIAYHTGKRVRLPKMRAFTLKGLCIYLGCSEVYFREFKRQNRENAEDFLAVIEHLEEIIYTQKFSGAAAGFLNANIISRDLGLADKQELTAEGGKDLFPEKTDDELLAMLQQITQKLNG